MERTKEMVWVELKAALDRFQEMTNDGKTHVLTADQQRRKVEMLYRELGTFTKAA